MINLFNVKRTKIVCADCAECKEISSGLGVQGERFPFKRQHVIHLQITFRS